MKKRCRDQSKNLTTTTTRASAEHGSTRAPKAGSQSTHPSARQRTVEQAPELQERVHAGDAESAKLERRVRDAEAERDRLQQRLDDALEDLAQARQGGNKEEPSHEVCKQPCDEWSVPGMYSITLNR